jgi:two-component system nitrogen regulation response regulator GlnG
MLGTGTFRVDLYHRLKVFPIAMPSLAERLDDIDLLARHFLARQSAGQAATGMPLLTPEFLEALRRRPWPGNVRELKHAIEYAIVVARGGVLRPEHLPAPEVTAPAGSGSDLTLAAGRLGEAVKEWSAAARREFMTLPEPDLHHRAILLLETTLLREALAHTGGNRTAAAKLLGLDRATLRTKLRHLGIDD